MNAAAGGTIGGWIERRRRCARSAADAGIAGIAKNTGITGVAEFSRNAAKDRQNSSADCGGGE